MNESRAERAPWYATAVWGLRRYAVVVIACGLGSGIALPLLSASESSYQAEALVVALQLEMDQAALAPYGQAVFTSDAMQARVTAESGQSATAETDADRLVLVAAEDSIVHAVRARSDEATSAAQLANDAAAAYVVELNKGGSGVGTFALQTPAQVPSRPTSEGPPVALRAVMGIIGGTLLGLGLIVLLAAVRRPVLRAGDVESAVGKPVLGVVVMPAARAGRLPDPHEVPGLVPMARALLPLIDGSVVLASSPQAAVARQRLLLLLALTLTPYRDLFVSAPLGVQSAVAARLGTVGADSSGSASGIGLELVDGVAPVDTLELPDWPLPVILVVGYGEPNARMRRLVANHLDDEILTAVIVDERGWLLNRHAAYRSRRRDRAASAAAASALGTREETPLVVPDSASPAK